jgi:hypothetical protein
MMGGMGRGRVIEIIGGIDDGLLLSHSATGLEWVFAFKLTTETLAVGSEELSRK